ncbi:MAG: tail fiber domain-containing protein [Candidatus Saccharibacteria bacterium]|nr:tail fiber domain-containing protein [Candidatus Saccharibacteria bacterium]
MTKKAHTKNQMLKSKHTTRFGSVRFQKRALHLLVCFFLLALTVFSYTRVYTPTRVEAAPSSTLNFQARLYNNSGDIVTDGNYHIEFKIYNSEASGQSAQGTCVGGATDDCLWVETRTTGNLVSVKNGYFSVNLGDVTALPDINWDQDLYLTMNVGDNGGSASWDGEMSPRIKLTSVPYAFQANTARELEVQDSGFTGNLSFDTLTADRDILLPNASGTVILDNTLSDTAFIQNGNSFGQAAILGTNDSFDLRLETGGTTRLTLDATTGNVTLTSDLAVNGGDITSTGALNITPGGVLTVGATGQTATLQGSATTITSNGAGNDITLSSADQIILNSTGTIELQDNTNITGALDVTGAATVGTDLAVDTNTLFVDGSGDSVGIGTTGQTAKLHVLGSGTPTTNSSSSGLIVQNDGTTGSNAGMSIISGNAAYSQLLFGDTDSENIGRIRYDHSADSLAFRSNAQDVLTLNSSGTGLFSNNLGVGNQIGSSVGDVVGFKVDHSAPAVGCLYGCYANQGYITVDLSGGNANLGVGYQARVSTTADANTLNTATGILLQDASLGSGSTITDNTGIRIAAMTSGTNNSGLTIGEATGTNQANLVLGQNTIPSGAYSIYNSSSDGNYLQGNTAIGTTSTTAKLGVTGTSSQPAAIFTSSGAITGPNDAVVISSALARNSTTSTYQGALSIESAIVPESSSSNISFIDINGSVNQTGGANGITNGVLIRPTLTAATDFRAINLQNNAGYGIYQAGASATNYFAGNTSIGTNDATNARLTVEGQKETVPQLRINSVNGGSIDSYFTFEAAEESNLDDDLRIGVSGGAGDGYFTFNDNGTMGINGTKANYNPEAGLEIFQPDTEDYLYLSTDNTTNGDVLKVEADGDLAVDSDTLFVSAADNRVGIGNASPGATLQVNGGGSIPTFIANNNAGTGDIAQFQDGGTSIFQIADGGVVTSTQANGTLIVQNPVGSDGLIDLDVDGSSRPAITVTNGGAGPNFVVRGDGRTGIGGTTSDARLTISNSSVTANAWGLNGIQARLQGGTFIDDSTAGSGTATDAVINSVGQSTLEATNASVTTTNAYGFYLAGAPVSGTNQTLTNTYGLRIAATSSVDGAGGTPTNSYGLYVDAQTGATNNYSAIFQGGNVGIGTTTPGAKLEVSGDIYLSKESDRTIKVANSTTSSTAGAALNILGADGNSATGGAINITGGAAGGFSTGGAVTITGGFGLAGGATTLSGGSGGFPGSVTVQGGAANGTDNAGAGTFIDGGQGTGTGNGGSITLRTAPAGSTGSSLNALVTRLQVASTGNITADSGTFFVDAANDRVGVGTTGPGVLLHVSDTSIDNDIFRLQDSDGTCNYNPESGSVTVTCSSDERLKSNIADSSLNALDLLNQYRVRDYTVNASGDQLTGVIAQEVQQLLPDRVHLGDDGYLTVDMPSTWELVKGIQELSVGVAENKQAVSDASSLNNIQAAQISNINSQISSTNSQISSIQSQLTSGSFNSLNVSGSASLAKLTVTGNTTVQGKLTVGQVEVSGNLTIGGLLHSKGQKPEVEALAAAGQDAIVNVDGTDTAGTLTIKVQKTSSETLIKGEVLELDFNKAYSVTPRVVITPVNEEAVELPVYVVKTNQGFKLIITNAAQDGAEYKLDYFVIGSEGIANN